MENGDIQIQELPLLSLEEQKPYEGLLDKPFLCCLRGQDPWGIQGSHLFNFVALSQGRPVGLLVAVYWDLIQQAELISLYVDKHYRNRKIATRLLSQLEQNLQAKGCKLLAHTYLTQQPLTCHLEALFQKQGWDLPYLFIVRCHFNAAEFHPSWLDKQHPLPADTELFFWKNLLQEEREKLLHLLSQGGFPKSISPFHEEQTIEPCNSLGLKKNGKIIGWVITNRTASDTIQYSSLYIEHKYRLIGYSMRLLATSCQIHKQHSVEIPKAVLNLNLYQVTDSWIRFIKKRLVPHTTKIERLNRITHLL